MVVVNMDLVNFSVSLVDIIRGICMIFGIIFLVIGFVVLVGNIFIFYVVNRDFLKCFNKFINVFNIVLIVVYFFVGMVVFLFIGVLNIFRG